MTNENYILWLSEVMVIAMEANLPYPTTSDVEITDYFEFLYQDDLTPSEALISLYSEEQFSS